jgi:aldehyde:ferredoxin oxidoreductase
MGTEIDMCKNGCTGRLLQVDLARGTLQVVMIEPDVLRLFPGGKALAAYLLLKELPAGVEPLSPANRLVIANGLLTGAPVSTATRFTVAARSPLTGAYGESEAGGFWGPELRLAGFDALVISGRAVHPVYLSIRDGEAELRDASELWGRDPEHVQDAIRRELGDKLTRILQIGLGGENLVRYAAITNELRHFNGRNGLGAVMGSKQLKAIAVRGHGRYLDLAHDPQTLAEIGRKLARQVKEHPIGWDLQDKGTPGITGAMNAGGMLPTFNFCQGAFDGIDQIKWEAYESQILTARRSCYACAVRCKREVTVADGPYAVSSIYGGPEYEAVAGFGSDCGVDDLRAIAKANELCNIYTLDTISTSATIAFAMECFEHGLLTLEQTQGLDLRFGNADAMLAAIHLIAQRRGIGQLLAEGSRRAAAVIGGEAPLFAIHVKGQELSMHDPRGKVGVGIGFAVSESGADHLVSYHDTLLSNPGSVSFQSAAALGITQALPPRDLSAQKVEYFRVLENWSSFHKSSGFCYFGPAPRSFIQTEDVVAAINAATGYDWGIEAMLAVGERATNLARVFNVREGFSARDDTLPERLFTPLDAGALAGVAVPRAAFAAAMQQLYRLKDWDPVTTAPSRARLRALEIEWVADLLDEPAR